MPPAAILESFPETDKLSWKDQIKVPHASVQHTPTSSEQQAPRTIDELIRLRAIENPEQPIISYPSSGIEYVDYTSQEIDIYALRVAEKYNLSIPQRQSSSEPESVVGLLGPSNFEYFISILALTKLGHTVLFLSTRISTAAYSSLLQATGCNHVLIDSAFEDVAIQVKEGLPSLQIHKITERDAYNYEITDPAINTRLDQNLDAKIESTKISWIIHSSGSTGLPKPIFQTHHAALKNYASNLNLRGFITLPLYHAHGISSVFRALTSRKQIYMYNASLPLTQQYLLNIMKRYDFQILYGVPYALKLLGETGEGIAALAKLQVVMFGGSACPDALGDRLVENGVNLISHYGTTETGQLMTSFREPGDKAWDYVRVPEAFQSLIKFEERSPGIYELIGLEGLPSKVASNRPDNSYATKDLFTPHPTIPNAWKYFARLDDTIVLMNGEKVIPIAFEQLVRDNIHVAEAVMFGSGKNRVGMIIIPSDATKDMPEDEIERLLVPVLAKANEDMPGYAQLSLEMLKILPAGTPYPRTDKGTVIRAAFYKTFDAQIEAVYEAAEVSTGTLSLSEAELREYIRVELGKLLTPSTAALIEDSTDFFSVGIDSLQAIQLRSVLSRNIQTNGQKLTSNIVFDFPCINLLAAELYRLRTGGESATVSTKDKMAELIAKYSQFEPHVPVENTTEGQFLVVTGATGSLGAHVVAQLVVRPDIKKVYCLVRASSVTNARTRIIRSMRDRFVYHYLPLEARQKIVALPSNFAQNDLGLDLEVYNEIATNITGLIHCAWSVNFNLGLGSFEADCIAGAHNLLALCLKAKRPEPATYNFCSSVSAVAATKGGFVKEALPETLDCAQGMGYAQSKLVTENICVQAAQSYGVKTRVLRVGQVVADTAHGIWNATEAIPLMLQAGLTIGAIPRLDENPLWLPVDIVASAVTEISLADAGAAVLNVVNHQSFHWTRDLLPALHQAGLEFSEPSQREWVSILRNSNPDPVANPPIKLLEFFASKYDNDLPRKGLSYDTSFARFLSPTLAAAPVLDQQLVDRFVKQFCETSWIINTPETPARRLIVVAGPCGAGKSTVAKAISEKYSIPWVEGDHIHSEESVHKMTNGIALSDSDRWLWLESLKATALLEMTKMKSNGAIITCSALKQSYRAELRNSRVWKTTFIALQANADILKERMGAREGHFMKPAMLESQLHSLEAPGVEETDVVPIDVGASKDDVLSEILSVLGGVLTV
ncbi:hypothetical protein BP6252_11822 [Coleophoma cylindrospora]|uniref:gluconokinase n=1 Tax=Coleophoma cylindrospora TaxID=1849047 RepID=A0A3D8QKS5_9HELO|nr:hypothetical protein BP6252_11822 [Coleophoma cylindrospora]